MISLMNIVGFVVLMLVQKMNEKTALLKIMVNIVLRIISADWSISGKSTLIQVGRKMVVV